MRFDYSKVPLSMKRLKQWGLFHLKWIPERQKYTKIPYNPITGEKGKSNDSSTWADFNTAYRVYSENDYFDGLAFYFTNGFAGLDGDHIKDNLEDWKNGDTDLNNLINKIISLTKNTYIEISQSGEGIHAIFKGKMPGSRHRREPWEMYEKGRFFALTGNTIQDHPKVQALNDREMKVLYHYTLGSDKPKQSKEVAKPKSVDLSVDEIIDKMLHSEETGPRDRNFMYAGDLSGYESQSNADLAFANDLAFWTGKDPTKMDAIFRRSALMRPKWDVVHDGKHTYGQMTINRAIQDTENVYGQNEDQSSNYDFEFNNKGKARFPFPTWDDRGLGERLFNKYGGVFKYVKDDRIWYHWNGQNWETNSTSIDKAANDIRDNVLPKEKLDTDRLSGDISEKDAQKAFASFKKKSRQTKALTNMEKEFSTMVSVDYDAFDNDKYLLNTPSGYIDLKTGDLHQNDKSKMMSMITNAEYSTTTPTPVWNKFLKDTFKKHPELVKFFQKVIGYSIIAGNDEQKIFDPFGDGNNGKSVALNTISYVLGSYANILNASSITTKGNKNNTLSEFAQVGKARFLVVQESNEGDRLDESLIKLLTGGDELKVRALYGSWHNMRPQFTIFMATNHLPYVRGDDAGIWRRLVIIPFDNAVPKDKIDIHLMDKLKKESAGILNWCVEGALLYQKEGLELPQSVLEANKHYREDNDVIQQFINEECALGPGYSATVGELYNAYADWAFKAHEHQFGRNEFSRRMKKKFSYNRRKFTGITTQEKSLAAKRYPWNA